MSRRASRRKGRKNTWKLMTAKASRNLLGVLEKKLEDAQAGIQGADWGAIFYIVDDKVELMLKVRKHVELRGEE